MGRNKAELTLNGRTFLDIQIDKMKNVGIREIFVSGFEKSPDGTVFVPDIFPRKGPLSGIHAGLKAMTKSCAFVLAVDTPLIPVDTIAHLIEKHQVGQISLLEHNKEPEPLIGVYDKCFIPSCEKILSGEKTGIRRLLDLTGYEGFEYTGDPNLIINCNTEAEYRCISQFR